MLSPCRQVGGLGWGGVGGGGGVGGRQRMVFRISIISTAVGAMRM